MSDLVSYQHWLEPAFGWLDANWTEVQTWQDVRPQFLATLGITEQELSTPECRVVAMVLEHAEALPDDAQRRQLLLVATERNELVNSSFARWQQEGGAESAPADAPAEHADEAVQYFEGHGWMRFEPASQQWAPARPPEGHEADTPQAAVPGGTETGAGVEPEQKPALAELPAQSQEYVDQVVQQELKPLLDQILGDIDTTGLSPEDVREALAAALESHAAAQ
jgi:hypothetical protein